MTIDSGRGRPGPTWSHKLVSGRIPAIKRRLPEDDLGVGHSRARLLGILIIFSALNSMNDSRRKYTMAIVAPTDTSPPRTPQ